MAHSNRKKIRQDRGGQTKHQHGKSSRMKAMRASRSAMQAERLKEVLAWEKSRHEKKAVVSVSTKKKRIKMIKPVVLRRLAVIFRLETQLKKETHESSIVFINKQLEILKKRV